MNKEYKSLASIDGKWSNETPREGYSSSIQIRTHKLYHKALEEFTLDDIRFMIGQQVGLSHLIPKALDYLSDDILVETCYYNGDLLHSVLVVPDDFWKKNKNLLKQTCSILANQRTKIEQLDLSFEADRRLDQDFTNFMKRLCEL